jgi:phage-related tail protein
MTQCKYQPKSVPRNSRSNYIMKELIYKITDSIGVNVLGKKNSSESIPKKLQTIKPEKKTFRKVSKKGNRFWEDPY